MVLHLQTRMGASRSLQVAPYADGVLDAEMQRAWLAALRDVLAELAQVADAEVRARPGLPQQADVRARLLGELRPRALGADLRWRLLTELPALLELGLQEGVQLRAWGD